MKTGSNYDSVSQEWLVFLFQCGDMEATAELLWRHKGEIIGYLRWRYSDSDAFEDIFQNLFLSFWNNGCRYTYQCPINVYLKICSRYQAMSYFSIRRHGHPGEIPLEEKDDEGNLVNQFGDDGRFVAQCHARMMVDAVSKNMTELQRQSLRLWAEGSLEDRTEDYGQVQNAAWTARRMAKLYIQGRKGRIHTQKLTLDQVREIRRRAAVGEKRQKIADEFGVSRSNVNNIVRGHTFKELQT